MVPTTDALQQCIRILPPVLVDHPDGYKPSEEVSTKCNPGIFDALVRSVCFGCILEQREHLETACMLLLCHCIVLGLCGKVLVVGALQGWLL